MFEHKFFIELQQKIFTMLESFHIVFVCKGNATKQSFGGVCG